MASWTDEYAPFEGPTKLPEPEVKTHGLSEAVDQNWRSWRSPPTNRPCSCGRCPFCGGRVIPAPVYPWPISPIWWGQSYVNTH